MYLQRVANFPPQETVVLQKKSFENYQGVYGLEGIDEIAAKMTDGVFLSVKAQEDGLFITNEIERHSFLIHFEGYKDKIALFSQGYEFEFDGNNRPIAVKHGNTHWVFWGI